MKTTKQDFLNQWNEITKMKLFEIEVIDSRLNEKDWIVFDITTDGKIFRAEHIALNQIESTFKFIAFCESNIDLDFDIDQNLSELYDVCINAICNSEFFEIPNED